MGENLSAWRGFPQERRAVPEPPLRYELLESGGFLSESFWSAE